MLWSLVEELFPIHRTLVNDGFDRSLGILQKRLPFMKVLRYPSGMKVWDWVIPGRWNVRDAYVADSRGRRLIDFKASNLHLSAYSVPFRGEVSREVLFKHLKTLPDQPTVIPYNFLYYRKDWEFNVAHDMLGAFKDSSYRVHIDVDTRPGTLKVGEAFFPGKTAQEIWISSYLCHPTMANDNVSGVAAAVGLMDRLARGPKRRYSYRLLIWPETVGPVAYLSQHEKLLSRVVGGYNVYICGDRGPLTYKASYQGNGLADRAARHVLRQGWPDARLKDFIPFGSDERQFNAPGVRLPIGALTRSGPGEFAGYHTSGDDLSVISPESLSDTVEALSRMVDTIEADRVYKNRYRGEPCFSRHDFVVPGYHQVGNDRHKNAFRILANEVDGTRSLLDIAEKWGIPMDLLAPLAKEFERAGLISAASPRCLRTKTSRIRAQRRHVQ